MWDKYIGISNTCESACFPKGWRSQSMLFLLLIRCFPADSFWGLIKKVFTHILIFLQLHSRFWKFASIYFLYIWLGNNLTPWFKLFFANFEMRMGIFRLLVDIVSIFFALLILHVVWFLPGSFEAHSVMEINRVICYTNHLCL